MFRPNPMGSPAFIRIKLGCSHAVANQWDGMGQFGTDWECCGTAAGAAEQKTACRAAPAIRRCRGAVSYRWEARCQCGAAAQHGWGFLTCRAQALSQRWLVPGCAAPTADHRGGAMGHCAPTVIYRVPAAGQGNPGTGHQGPVPDLCRNTVPRRTDAANGYGDTAAFRRAGASGCAAIAVNEALSTA